MRSIAVSRGSVSEGVRRELALPLEMGKVEVCLLGPPLVFVDGEPVSLGERSLRLLARLAIASAPLSTDRLLDDVWGSGDVDRGAVRVALSRLRSAIGREAVAREDAGYALGPSVDVDIVRFERLIRRADDAGDDAAQRRALLEQAIEIWRGAALDGFTSSAWAHASSVRLEELRALSIDQVLSMRLETGAPDGVIADLRAHVAEDPTRERRAELLGVALYRAGRQVDALATLSTLRRHLRDELGLTPSPRITDLEMRILRHDPALRVGQAERRPEDDPIDDRSRLRAIRALVKVEAFDDAIAIADEMTAAADASGDRRRLASTLIMRARIVARVDGDASHDDIDRAQAIARDLADGPLIAQAALARFGSGVPADKSPALVELLEPLDLLPAEAPERLDLYCAAAAVVAFIDASETADRLLDAAERTWVELGSARAEAVWLAARAVVHGVRREPIDEVEKWAERSLELGSETRDPTVVLVASMALLQIYYRKGDLEAVDRLLGRLAAAAEEASIPFGLLRVSLCETSNALCRGELGRVPALIERSRETGRRLRAFAVEGATAAQQAIWMRECGDREELAQLARMMASMASPGPWHALAAWCGDAQHAGELRSIALQVPKDDYFLIFVALAAEVARDRGDPELAAWCRDPLEDAGDSAIIGGFGTVVVGFAPHYAALAAASCGDREAEELAERAVRLADWSGARLWAGHSRAELAALLVEDGRLDRAETMLAGAAEAAAATGSTRLAERCMQLRDRVRDTA